jgi:acetyl esterase/lipase
MYQRRLGAKYQTQLDITYGASNNFDLKLDVYSPAQAGEPKPTLFYIHGGGWLGEYAKDSAFFSFLPFLQLGWVVVNVDYRPSSVSCAPAAVEDCLCALRWVERNADLYNIDLEQLVMMGHSAGGHLALTTAMIPLARTGLGAPCALADMYGPKPQTVPNATAGVRPAAVVNWFGITDVAEIITAPNEQPYAVRWIGNQRDGFAVAKSVSPLTYVRPGLPPIITIHGDRDEDVPYSHALRLHKALGEAAVTHKLVTIPGGGHGQFGLEITRDAYTAIFQFLKKAGLTLLPSGN